MKHLTQEKIPKIKKNFTSILITHFLNKDDIGSKLLWFTPLRSPGPSIINGDNRSSWGEKTLFNMFHCKYIWGNLFGQSDDYSEIFFSLNLPSHLFSLQLKSLHCNDKDWTFTDKLYWETWWCKWVERFTDFNRHVTLERLLFEHINSNCSKSS